jgi:hypothetical protein
LNKRNIIERERFADNLVMITSTLVLHLFICIILGLSYNQPKFCPTATWNPNATTFPKRNIVNFRPAGIFVDSNNTVYALDQSNRKIYIWTNNSINPTSIILDILFFSFRTRDPVPIFVTMNGDIYIDDVSMKDQVQKWPFFMYGNSPCSGLFVDINNTLFCSMSRDHQVVKKWLNDNAKTSSIAAGTGASGSALNKLSFPYGIFVDTNFDLYVADSGNDRIQLFQSSQLNAITVAGAKSLNITIILNRPTGIVLDADKYLFIVDSNNNRVVRSGPNGFRCIAGCSYSICSSPNQLSHPHTLSFDSYGNMFVFDEGNNRIQKFLLSTNSCSK